MSQRENLPKSDRDLAPGDQETKSTSLRHGTLGLMAIIFFFVAAAAPLAGMSGAFSIAVALGNGTGAAGMYVVVGLVLMLFAVGYATMSHYVTNTGAFFAYVGRGLGIRWGVASAMVSLLAYLAIQWGVLGFLSGQMSLQFADKFGISLDWWIYAIIMMVLVWALSALSVDVGAKVLGVLLIIEVVALFIVAFAILIAGGADGIAVEAAFNPSNIFAGGLTAGAGVAFAFALASFVGFEATAIYGEESKNPKKTVPRATYISVMFITFLFAVVGLAIVSGLGADGIVDKVFAVTAVDGIPLTDPAAVLFGLTDEYVGTWLTLLFSWIVLTSLFAALLAFQNSASRYLFSMGRAGVLPKVLDRTNSRQSPVVATTVVLILGLALIILSIIVGWDPFINLFSWFGAVAVISIVLTEILVSIAVVVYFQRTKQDTRLWHTKIAPIGAVILLSVGLYMLVARFNLFSLLAPDPDMCPGDAGSGCGPFEMTPTGWVLVLLTPTMFIVGLILGTIRKNKENYDAVQNFAS